MVKNINNMRRQTYPNISTNMRKCRQQARGIGVSSSPLKTECSGTNSRTKYDVITVKQID